MKTATKKHDLAEQDRIYQARLEELQKEIQKGLDSGPATPFDPHEIIRKAQERMKKHSAR